jgi:ATP-dependent DNA ligase
MKSFDDIYERLRDQPFTAEWKYDGQRAQIHALRASDQVTVSIFSRHLENMTDKVVCLFIIAVVPTKHVRSIRISFASSRLCSITRPK